MSLEGGDDYAAGDAIGACMGCGQRAHVLHGGHCSACAGIPPAPAPSRLDHLRVQRQTLEDAIRKTRRDADRAHYRERLEALEIELEKEEA